MTYANRGQTLEHLIEYANGQYRAQGLALVQKIPTPVKVLKVYPNGKLTGFYEKKSTVDYTGVYKGKFLAFDAKETKVKTRFDLSNIEEHQYQHLVDTAANGGIGFLIVSFSTLDEIYFLPLSILSEYWQDAKVGGRKSIPHKVFKEKTYRVEQGRTILDYLDVIEKEVECIKKRPLN